MHNYFHYFSHPVNKEVKEVYWQTLLSNLALSLVFIFEPIYLYVLGYALIHIMWFYVVVYAAYVILIGFGAKITSRIGYKHSIFLSNVVYVIYWILLYSIRFYPILFFIAPIFFALQKSFFWPAFDADVALHDGRRQQGREVGVLFSIIQATLIISPLIGGLISENFGFLFLFISASSLMIFSAWPLFATADIYDRHQFHFYELWNIFRQFPSNFFGYFGYAEDLMIMSLWPIFMFIAIPKISLVGLISTIAMCTATILMLYVGRKSDFFSKQFLIERNSVFYALTWMLRFLAQGIPMVLLFDILTKTLKGIVQVPLVALTFEIAGSKGPDYAIAYSVFYELSLSVGKIITALGAIAILAYTGNIFLVFGFVGVLTLAYGLLKR